jgi:hypothetical protein
MISSFEQLCQEAADVTAELLAIDTGGNRKLNAKAWIAASLMVPGADKKQAELLLVEVEKPENAALASTFRRLLPLVLNPSNSGPLRKHFGAYSTPESDAALARLRCTVESLSAAVAMHAAKKFPEAFGPLTRPNELEETIGHLSAKRDELLAKIESSWTIGDMTVHDIGDREHQENCCKLSVKFTNNGVFFGADFATRVVGWILHRRSLKAAA